MKTTMHMGGPLTGLVLALHAAATLAMPINLDTGISLDVEPGTTGTTTLSATNFNDGTPVTNWNAWNAALQLLPNPGAVGTMTISGNLLPTTNGSLTDPDAGTFNPNGVLSGTGSNGATAFTAIGFANNGPDVTTWIAGQSYNLANLTFTASGDAQGTWTLYAVNQGSTISNWFDDFGNPTTFGNTPSTAGSSLTLGTITAVPEPASLTLALAAGTVGLLGLRRRKSAYGAA